MTNRAQIVRRDRDCAAPTYSPDLILEDGGVTYVVWLMMMSNRPTLEPGANGEGESEAESEQHSG